MHERIKGRIVRVLMRDHLLELIVAWEAEKLRYSDLCLLYPDCAVFPGVVDFQNCL